MKHFIKTAAGVSSGFIMFNPIHAITQIAVGYCILQGLIGGIGQGGGGDPIIFCHGAEMNHILGWVHLLLWIVSYVHDNTLLHTFIIGTSPETIISEMTKMMRHWQRLLQITGGNLCLEKCKVGILAWHKKNYWGLPTACAIHLRSHSLQK